MGITSAGDVIAGLRSMSGASANSIIQRFVKAGNTADLTSIIDDTGRQLDNLFESARREQSRFAGEIEALQASIDAERAGPVDALDGVYLLSREAPEHTIDSLRARSTIWNNGLLDASSSALIENQIKTKAVNAGVGRILGQPIATAHIPSGTATPHRLHVIPDTVVSPPQGFRTKDEAFVAADHYMADHPDKTVIIGGKARDGSTPFHVVAAPIDTGIRTVTRTDKGLFKRRSREVQAAVDIDVHDKWIDTVKRSDGTITNGTKTAEGWPSGHTPPMKRQEMLELNLALRHESRLTLLEREMNELRGESGELTAAIIDAKPSRDTVVRFKSALGAISEIPDRQGNGTLSSWESEPILKTPSRKPVLMAFDERYVGTSVALPASTPAEAALAATTLDTDKILAIMQEADGTPRIVFTSINNKDLAKNGSSIGKLSWANNDVRAVVNPATRQISFRPPNGGSKTKMVVAGIDTDLPSVKAAKHMRVRKNDRAIQQWALDELVAKKVLVNESDTGIARWSEESPSLLLRSTNLEEAIQEAIKEVGTSSPDPSVFIFTIPGTLAHNRRFVAVRDNRSGDFFGQYLHSGFRHDLAAIIKNNSHVMTRTGPE